MSSRKNILVQFNTMASVSMTGTVISSVTNISYLDNIGVQQNWTGSPVGTFTVEISASYNEDINKNVLNPGSWVTMTQPDGTSFSLTAAGTASQGYMDITQTSSPWIRTVFTGSSGSGVMSTYITAKQV